MKKLFASFIAIGFFITAQAQVDSLQQYTGKYKFPDGTPISELTVSIENGTLVGSSVAGSSELKKTATSDVFEIVAYNGLATFKRSAEAKITGVKLEVNDMVMEGTKVDAISVNLRTRLVTYK